MGRRASIAVLLVIAMASLVTGSLESETLKQKVEAADAIVVGEIVHVRARKFSLTWYEDGSQGAKPTDTTFYDIARLKVSAVLKGQRPGLVNKADKSNPVDWVSVAYHSKGQETHPFRHTLVSFDLGQKGIWFLRHEDAMTGLHFIGRRDNLVPVEKLDEVKELIGPDQPQGK